MPNVPSVVDRLSPLGKPDPPEGRDRTDPVFWPNVCRDRAENTAEINSDQFWRELDNLEERYEQ
jgi:hypothetical protein